MWGEGVISDDFGIVVETALGHRAVVGGHGRFDLSGAIGVPGKVAIGGKSLHP